MPLPPFTDTGDLPVGLHPATPAEVIQHLGTGTPQRQLVAARLERICHVAFATGHVAKLVVFGSFVTSKPEPNDIDVFLLMENAFDASRLTGEAQLLFDHLGAHTHFGASVFWLRRESAWEGEQAAVEYWQVKRGGGRRGIVVIEPGAP
jgi:hypothetical protein